MNRGIRSIVPVKGLWRMPVLSLSPNFRASIVPSAEVDALRTHTCASGFRNVYETRGGWVAKIKEGNRLVTIPGSRQPQAHQCAAYVVDWYKNRFGERWELALESRKRPYWRVKYSERYQGFYIEVFVRGSVTIIRQRGRQRPLVFVTKPLANAYAKLALPKQCPHPRWRQ
jgi:hypothetical protein